jgi:exodeoxyribonuclease VII large subunit
VRYKRNPFPEGPPSSVSVIHSISAQALVYEDFKDQVKPVMHVLEVEWLPTDLLNASAIAQRIQQAKGDILVLIRGGGDPVQFEVLESRSVVEALARRDAFRVLGVGHAGTASLLEFVCDHVANTPSGAGTFIRDQIRLAEDQRGRMVSAAARCEALAAEKEAVLADLRQKDQSIKEIRQQFLIGGAFVAGICLVLGFLLARWMSGG